MGICFNRNILSEIFLYIEYNKIQFSKNPFAKFVLCVNLNTKYLISITISLLIRLKIFFMS